MQTASRGGIVAAAIGLGIMLIRVRRPWPRRYVLCAMASIWIVLGFAAWLPTMRRFGLAMGGQDLSILSRLGLWRAAPRMMVDAPGGWGLGHSADVFHQWYQPLDQSQLFTSLINSHLTWMVEIGWPGRFLYVFAWLAVLTLCWLQRADVQRHPWLTLAFSVWIAFAITAWFNSVAESPWLWLVPVAGLGGTLWWRSRTRQWLTTRQWLGAALGSGALLGGLLLLGVNTDEQPRLRLQGSQLVLGNTKKPAVWLLVNRDVLGGSYGHTLQRSLRGDPNQTLGSSMSIGLVDSLDALPPNVVRAKVLVVCGALDDEQLVRLKALLPVCAKLVLLNPTFFPQALGADSFSTAKLEVLTGEFSQVPASAWTEAVKTPVRTVTGAGDFLPRWPELLLDSQAQTAP